MSKSLVAPLRHTGDSSNIAFYTQADPLGYWAEVCRNDPTARTRSRKLRFSFTVYKNGNKPVTSFTYQPASRPAPGPLPDRTVTRLVRQALAEMNQGKVPGGPK